MVQRKYQCEVCGFLNEDKASIIEHEQIPIKGKGYGGLILKRDSIEFGLLSLFEGAEKYFEGTGLDAEHNALYAQTFLYLDLDGTLIANLSNLPVRSTHIEKLLETEEFFEFTPEELYKRLNSK